MALHRLVQLVQQEIHVQELQLKLLVLLERLLWQDTLHVLLALLAIIAQAQVLLQLHVGLIKNVLLDRLLNNHVQ